MEKINEKLKNLRIVITGGGSGGHVSVATGFIEEYLKQNGQQAANILYIGGKAVTESFQTTKSIEQRSYEGGKIPFVAIRSGKLQRSFSIKSIQLLFGVFSGLIDSYRELTNFQPDIIFSTGGYITVPVAIIGRLKKIPIYLHEQTANIGLANKIVSKFAKKIFIAFSQASAYFPQEKTIHTGNIVRKDIWKLTGKGPIVTAIKTMIPQARKLPIIYISGGGQGSRFLNLITRQMLPYLLLSFQVILQTGENLQHKDYEVMVTEMKKLSPKFRSRFFVSKFVPQNEIGFLFHNIDMYVGRAGANTVYEMGLLQKPSIFIPIPWVTKDEQTENAQILANCGLGKIVPEGEVTAETLFKEIKNFWKLQQQLSNKERKVIKQKTEKVFIRNGVKKVFSEIEKDL